MAMATTINKQHGFNSHTARGSSKLSDRLYIPAVFQVSIPILRVGVQFGNQAEDPQIQAFQFPYCAWEFKLDKETALKAGVVFQFPYCAWEFKVPINLIKKGSGFQFPYCAWEFNGRLSAEVISIISGFQFPYCAWEFNDK